ncbi:MAG TPA: hypothetical protein DD490_27900 [Acidobacteria bacterium]|nr:hypothetical protein [Acidobacteriota bacterium]
MRRETAPGWALPLLILLATAGAWIGSMLTSYHLSAGKAPWKVFQAVCGTDGGGCSEVLASPWAVLPGGIPLALAGALYFGGLALWYLVVGLANRRGRFWHALPLAVQVAGAMASIVLLTVMLTRIGALCWWCTLSHLINFALLFVAWKAWPRDDGYSNEPAVPSVRLGLAGVLLMAALVLLAGQWLLVKRSGVMAEEANRYARTFFEDVDLQRYLHERQTARDLAVRPDDPIRGEAAAPHTLVVFSDFQCPGCRAFAEFSERELMPRFPGRLRIVYKHFPLQPECNPGLAKTVHPRACEAAFAAEAARELGGSPAFWKMHDLLFARQATLETGPWADLARQAGLDGAAVADRVSRRVALDRVLADTALGRDVRVDHTPFLLLDGRPVDDWSRIEVWQALVGGTEVRRFGQ